MIFNYFSIPPQYQRRVLMYGVLGAIVMRLIFILIGLWLISFFHWIFYVFGFFLVITGIKMLIYAETKNNLEDNFVLRWMQKHLNVTAELHGERFLIKRNHILYVTPLFL